MEKESPAFESAIEAAIDRRALKVTPETPLIEVITLMAKAQSSCGLPGLDLSSNTILIPQARASLILVAEQNQLLGVFDEKEALKVITHNTNLTEVTVAQGMKQPPVTLTSSQQPTVFDALTLLREHHTPHLPIVDQGQQIAGIITGATVKQALPVDQLLKTQTLAELISSPVIQAPTTTSVLDIAHLMVEHQVDCVILSENNHPVGSLLARDIIGLHRLELDLSQIQAQSVMSAPLPGFSPSESILAAYWQMQQQLVQRLLVIDEQGNLLSVVSPTTFLYTLNLEALRHTAEQVQHSTEQFQQQKTALMEREKTILQRPPLENATELLDQLECSRILGQMSLRIRESLDLDQILQTAVKEVWEFLQSDRVLIYRFHPDMSGTVVVEAVSEGWRPALNSSLKDTCFGQDYAEEYKRGRTQVIENIYTAGLTQCHIDILVLYDVWASLVVPIMQRDNLWGLLCAYHCSGPRYWRPFEVDLLTQLATHMAIAIQQSELYQQLENELRERKRTEERLKKSLKEKELLLKEIHHRVKNNLQVISSILRLQSDYVKDENILRLFKDSQNRIRSIALVHEKLYQSKDLLNINFDDYIRELMSNLKNSYPSNSPLVKLTTNAQEINFNIETAIPCSLLINELVSNAFKHAFPAPSEQDEILVTLGKIDENQFELTVKDNGIGFPEDLDFRDTESLGLELVCLFTEQLGGTIELERTNGTTFRIRFTQLDRA
ncbi:signal transduction histidine kinase [Gloeothece citriformis PCC 7424]|uniref:Signal transduction histidine kinase n=1 Tax=Gloeothece citriformis (strain PCC 7424) TaxID=65393 RepID=B7KJW5_GLOC7|nr:histidine kinase dimerization/phosphoacceptor domain -containing protein [Gloeothece citriformis]ACK69564.1 signal transduction histidine kinase [Gloeothece citriformis PCC 7424]